MLEDQLCQTDFIIVGHDVGTREKAEIIDRLLVKNPDTGEYEDEIYPEKPMEIIWI